MVADPIALSKIELFIRQFIQPNEEEWNAFVNILQQKHLKKRDLLLEGGQVCNFIGFINAGVIREYAYESGKESTVDFVSENQFVVDFQSFILSTPSRQYLEALTDVELLVFKKDGINRLYDKYKIWERFGRLIIEHVFCGVEAKRKKIIATTHEERGHLSGCYPKSTTILHRFLSWPYSGTSEQNQKKNLV
jgi:CRP-like cAMP-binding protein